MQFGEQQRGDLGELAHRRAVREGSPRADRPGRRCSGRTSIRRRSRAAMLSAADRCSRGRRRPSVPWPAPPPLPLQGVLVPALLAAWLPRPGSGATPAGRSPCARHAVAAGRLGPPGRPVGEARRRVAGFSRRYAPRQRLEPAAVAPLGLEACRAGRCSHGPAAASGSASRAGRRPPWSGPLRVARPAVSQSPSLPGPRPCLLAASSPLLLLFPDSLHPTPHPRRRALGWAGGAPPPTRAATPL